jgi:hypothetical protein
MKKKSGIKLVKRLSKKHNNLSGTNSSRNETMLNIVVEEQKRKEFIKKRTLDQMPKILFDDSMPNVF